MFGKNEEARLLAASIERSISGECDGTFMGPTDAELCIEALRAYAGRAHRGVVVGLLVAAAFVAALGVIALRGIA